MPDFITKNGERIKQAIDFLAVNRRRISIKMEGEQTLFDSMIVKADHGDPVSKAGHQADCLFSGSLHQKVIILSSLLEQFR